MTEPSLRRSMELDGRWEFVTDPTETGVEDNWMAPGVEWPERTRTVDVPMAWEELDELREYTGRAWYRRSFEIDGEALDGRDAVLRFGAVDYETTVWVNGEQVGHNEGGYLPFECDVTTALSTGENTVIAAVTDPEDIAEIPHGKQGDPWYTRVSGIWQSVRLDFRPSSRIDDAQVTPDLSTDTAAVEIDVRPGEHAVDELDCLVRALSADGTVAATATTSGGTPAEVLLDFDDPDYWHPESPTLYDLEVELRAAGERLDRWTDAFGMRSFETDGQQFLLNGEPITMRGVLEQGYYPETLYRPSGAETFEEEIAAAKELGFNLIRKHIKPPHPDFLAAADRMGILVWEEPANPTLYTETSRNEVREQTLAMVDRDYNHPSVVVWSIYNEEWGLGHADNEETLWTDEAKQRYLADQYRDLRERDPTRLICDNSGWAHVATDINDYHRYFVSPDRAQRWAADLDYICHHPSDNYATRTFDDTDAPIVLSELGTWGLCDVPALRDRYDGDPPWFDHDFLTPELKRPAGVDERFASSDLPDVFGDYDALADAWQRREFVSVKGILEEVRTHDAVAGYVITELSDIEWEFNGILDYRREQKNFYDEFAAVNAPITVVADLDNHVTWTGESITLRPKVVNDTDRSLSGTVEWSIADRSGTEPLSAPAHGIGDPDDPITVPLSSDRTVDRQELRVTYRTDRHEVDTTEPITVVATDGLSAPDTRVFAEGTLASRLAGEGITVTHELENVDLAITERYSDEIETFANRGGAVVQVPDSDGRMAAESPFSFHRVPEHESWIEAASFLYQDSSLLADLCPGARLGWAFERLYPFSVATDLDLESDTIHAGYIEGWLSNWGSPLVTRSVGAGSVTACAFRVGDHYGTHPTATLLVDRVLSSLTESS